MNRRKFLLSASVFVIALKLLPSTPTLAAPMVGHPDYPGVPYDELVRVENAFRILEDYKFGPIAQARIFGVSPVHSDSVGDLRERVHTRAIDARGPEVWKRVSDVEEIHRELTARLGPDNRKHLEWLENCPMAWGFECSFRDTLILGEPHTVALWITSVPYLEPFIA